MKLRHYLAGVAVALVLSCPSLASDAREALTRDEIQQARLNAYGALQATFGSTQHRYLSWRNDGNLMIAREPTFEPEVLVAGGERGPIARYSASRDGKHLMYVHDRKDTAGGSALMFLEVDKKGSTPVLVATGADVPSSTLVWSPDAQAVAFTQGTQLLELRRESEGRWTRRSLLKSGDPRHTAAVSIDQPVYSPDGSKLAFVSSRTARQTYIVVHDLAKDETTYVHPSPFADTSPVWSADSSELAFIREPINPTKDYRFSAQRSLQGGVPWSILAANVTSATLRTVWQAEFGAGSQLNGETLVWAPSGELLFLWEKTGWNQLYAVSSKGGTARLLTPAEGEVEKFDANSLSADGHTIVYRSNVGDLMRSHLWSVSLRGGPPKQLTFGEGSEGRAGVSGYNPGGHLVYVEGETVKRPPRLVLRSQDGTERTLPLMSDALVKRTQAVLNQLAPVQTISVKAADGLISHHVMITPQRPPPAHGYPVVVNTHGGPTEQTKPYDGYAYAFGQYLAQQGYLFIDMNFRGSTGFGLNYRLPAGRGATGGSEVKDIAALVNYLQARGDVDTKRMGIMGGSYGGHMVGLAMSRLPGAFASAVSHFGVTDWVVEMKKDWFDAGNTQDPLIYQRLSERLRIEDLAYASSPQLDNWRGPVLLTIGDLDKSGHMESVQDLGYQLLQRGVPVEFYVDPSGGHNVFAWDETFEFFERTLSGKE
ncbi:S9 family peptidase [Steroidobacter sp.]|uniref:S9 family peptidase n=1 Tax=Steroidobacter sp. TaxID=1978227 RepID=UPI001A49D299|nr:prolyl oligopeptidase family serine peptidase [Steroidobacter sp.]MBL8271873.1 S9 family peptidase [Steroidobacter sp.]